MELRLPPSESQPARPTATAVEESDSRPAASPRGTNFEPSDGDLLAAYRRQGAAAEPAFAALVARHGAMVHRTCLRILWDAGLAEDAAQATFVVLARRAGQIRTTAGPFLHGVAVRIARRALGAENLRKQRELQAGEFRRAAAANDQTPAATRRELWPEIEPLLDESIEQLPARQREALVLYYLEGHTQAAVADRMGLGRGTVAKQIQRALEKLRHRLTRRGLRDAALEPATPGQTTPLGALLFSHLGGFTGQAGCPAFLSQAVPHLSAAHTAAGFAGLSPTIATMAEGAFHMLSWIQLKSALTVAALLVVTSLGVAVAYDRTAGAGPDGDLPDRGAHVAPGDLPDQGPADPPVPPAPPNGANDISPADKAAEAQLDAKVSFSFADTTVSQILDTLVSKYGITLVYDLSAINSGALDAQLELEINDRSLRNALRTILQMADLEYGIERGAVCVWARGERPGSAAALAARLREQSPATALSAADQKTMNFMNQPATTVLSGPNFDRAFWSQSLLRDLNAVATGDDGQIPVVFEEGLRDRPIKATQLNHLEGTRWEVCAKLLSPFNLAWRLDQGRIVIVDRGRLSPEALVRRNQVSPEDEQTKQQLLKPVTMNLTDTTLKDALKVVREASGANIVYESLGLQQNCEGANVVLRVNALPARDALEFLMREINCSYRVENGVAVIYQRQSPPPEDETVRAAEPAQP